eukprot:4057921-Pyramimonas_sp.AAC.1
MEGTAEHASTPRTPRAVLPIKLGAGQSNIKKPSRDRVAGQKAARQGAAGQVAVWGLGRGSGAT